MNLILLKGQVNSVTVWLQNFMVQNFCEMAENDMNVNFCDNNFVIAAFFHNYCYSTARLMKKLRLYRA